MTLNHKAELAIFTKSINAGTKRFFFNFLFWDIVNLHAIAKNNTEILYTTLHPVSPNGNNFKNL